MRTKMNMCSHRESDLPKLFLRGCSLDVIIGCLGAVTQCMFLWRSDVLHSANSAAQLKMVQKTLYYVVLHLENDKKKDYLSGTHNRAQEKENSDLLPRQAAGMASVKKFLQNSLQNSSAFRISLSLCVAKHPEMYLP